MVRTLLISLAVIGFGSRAAAQPAATPVPGPCDAQIAAIGKAVSADQKKVAATELANMNLRPNCLSQTLLLGATQHTTFASVLKQLETRRTDKQAGAGVGASGTTNLVSKGTTAKVLSFAAEYGAITESVNKQIVTVQGSFDGIPTALVRNKFVEYCPTKASAPGCVHRGVFETLRRFSYGVSFDTSQSSQAATGTPTGPSPVAAQPVTFTASGHTIVNITAKAVVWNARDQTSKTFLQLWSAAQTKKADEAKKAGTTSPIDKAADDLLAAMRALLTRVEGDPAYKAWQQETVEAFTAIANPQQVPEVWADRQRALYAAVRADSPEVAALAANFAGALNRYVFEEDEAVRAIAAKPVLTFQYDHNRPNGKPATNVFRGIFDKGFGSRWSFAVNGAVETYHETPLAEIPDAGRVRDAQFGLQLQKDLGNTSLLGAAALSGAYYFQYQNSPAILNVTPGKPFDNVTFIGLPATATQVFAEKGHLHVGQLRLVLGQGSARVPISVSYSNRTELIDKKAWRGQLGVSYDFDALFGK